MATGKCNVVILTGNRLLSNNIMLYQDDTDAILIK